MPNGIDLSCCLLSSLGGGNVRGAGYLNKNSQHFLGDVWGDRPIRALDLRKGGGLLLWSYSQLAGPLVR